MTISFEQHIKPLFTEFDIASMKVAAGPASFDLSQYEEVKKRAGIILYEMTAGDMPCKPELLWSKENLKMFAKWIDEGMSP